MEDIIQSYGAATAWAASADQAYQIDSVGSDAEAAPAWRLLLVMGNSPCDSNLEAHLRQHGFTLQSIRDGQSALQIAQSDQCDLVVLAGEPSGMTTFQCCREIRRRSQIPVVFMGAEDTLDERLLAFDLGADEYLHTPIAAKEVERRLRAVLRRSSPVPRDDSISGPAGIELRSIERDVRVEGQPVRLTSKEFELLRLLLEHRGHPMTHDTISWRVWGYETTGSRNFMEAQISRLRAKLRDAGAADVITTERGYGYVIR